MTPDTEPIPADVRARIAELERRVRELEERERAERELRRAAESASAAKTFFVASVSHEVRTPMTAILGYADLRLTRMGPSAIDAVPPLCSLLEQAVGKVRR